MKLPYKSNTLLPDTISEKHRKDPKKYYCTNNNNSQAIEPPISAYHCRPTSSLLIFHKYSLCLWAGLCIFLQQRNSCKKNLQYPPFIHLASVILSGVNDKQVLNRALLSRMNCADILKIMVQRHKF